MSLPIVTATRYVLPLREGGSLPGVVEGNDLGTYVIKFQGAGQGPKALVAEIIVGELFRRLGLRVPELKLIELDPAIGKSEPDQEIQHLLVRSAGLNLAVDYLPGSFGYDGSAGNPGDDAMAKILWLDAFVANVDRSWRNTNLLVWHKNLWLIDHGAALYFHHSWMSAEKFASLPYDADDHVFSVAAPAVPAVAEELVAAITSELLTEVIALVPDEWLGDGDRERYLGHLLARLEQRATWQPGGAA
ncbi:aminotransferase class I and II [Kribbella antibiotica]|uniref:Aminotransferase class I and II n=1 Tax=Kribbella antibiotica TaxID=190195 RepID=A0A4R4ZL64_9ACTN|nr:HipA family kinase [Kribbella antibiotica]TDD59541.1 aminotransferase class I and II [Kribbella antibiotica]